MRIYVEAPRPDPVGLPPVFASWSGVRIVKNRTTDFSDVPVGYEVYEVHCDLTACHRLKTEYKERMK